MIWLVESIPKGKDVTPLLNSLIVTTLAQEIGDVSNFLFTFISCFTRLCLLWWIRKQERVKMEKGKWKATLGLGRCADRNSRIMKRREGKIRKMEA